MKHTRIYKLRYLENGDFYSAKEDYRRMSEIDRHMFEFAKTVGNGICEGWKIEPISGRLVKITYGWGLINGFLTETPWTKTPETQEPIRKKEALDEGLEIVSDFRNWSDPNSSSWLGSFYMMGGENPEQAMVFKNLGPDGEDLDNDGVIEGVLQPYYTNPPDQYYDNPYVKAINPVENELLLNDNADNFILAERASDDPFETFVTFRSSLYDASGQNSVLLARVVVRDGAIKKIDYTSTNHIKGLYGTISEMAQNYLERHRHGGGRSFDPPALKLATDVRKTRLVAVGRITKEGADGAAAYKIYGNKETSTTLEHRHTYVFDNNGNGYTQELVGNTDFHYHLINNFVVTEQSPLYGSSLEPHIHIVDPELDAWQKDVPIRVTVNGNVVTKGYIINEAEQYIIFEPGIINYKQAVYRTSFTLTDGSLYTYEAEARSVASFVGGLMKSFTNEYRDKMNNLEGEEGLYVTPTIRDPFTFVTIDDKNAEQGKDSYLIADPTPVEFWPEGTSIFHGETQHTTFDPLSGRTGQWTTDHSFVSRPIEPYFTQQTSIAALYLKEVGDTYTLLPWAARFIPITLVSLPQVDEVVVEILYGVEAQGVLKKEFLPFIQSEKFSSGVFDKSILPLIGHSGRIKEPASPEPFKTYTEDGYSFYATTTRTFDSSGHAHIVSSDRLGNGLTVATTVNGEIAISQPKDGLPIRITHTHQISSGFVNDVVNENVNKWQEVSPEEKHNHILDVPVFGSAKTIFSIADDIDGNLYVGTSDGLFVKPKDGGYKITINGYQYESAKSIAYEACQDAFLEHADLTGEYVEFSDDISAKETYTKLFSVQRLECQVFAYGPIFSGQNKNINGQNLPIGAQVEIEPRDIVRISNFYELLVKTEEALAPEDEILSTKEVPSEALEVYGASLSFFYNEEAVTGSYDGATKAIYLVKRSYDHLTVWGFVVSKDGSLVVCSNNKVLKRTGRVWNEVPTPIATTITRKLVRLNNGDILIPTNSGLVLLSSEFLFSKTRRLQDVDGKIDITDAIESSPSWLLVATEDGTYRSSDGGNEWVISLQDVKVSQFSRDYWMDTAGENENHIHYFLVNQDGNGITTNAFSSDGGSYSGIQHIHPVVEWEIQNENGHDHSIVASVYALSEEGEIFKTVNDGGSWEKVADAPTSYGEYGELIASFESLYLSCEKGLAKLFDSEWNLVLPSQKIKSHSWSYLFDRVLIGSDNILYEISENGINEIFSLSGGPFPCVKVDNQERYFGYSFNNKSNKVSFLSQVGTKSQISVSALYDLWKVENGGWAADRYYEVFADDKTVINTKLGVDRRNEMGLIFTVNTSNGTLDFTKVTTIASEIMPGQNHIDLFDATNFSIGKTLAVIKFPKHLTPDEYSELSLEEKEKADLEAKKGVIIEKRLIVSKSGNKVLVEKSFSTKIELPAQVKLLNDLDETTRFFVSIYQTNFSNIGKLNHEEVEDLLSWETAGTPFHLSSVHFSNLSSLTLAMKYAIPEIDLFYKNWGAYMMRFGHNPNDSDAIQKYFDITESNLRSGVFTSTLFNPTKSSAINVVSSGQKTYSDLIFIGTDAGLFVAKKEPDIPSNWFAIYDCPAGAIYDIDFPGGDKIMVAGENGVWATKGGTLKNWERQGLGLAITPAYFVKHRWKNFGAPGNTWWNSWGDDGNNLVDPDITNTLFVGGQNYAMFYSDEGSSWTASLIPMDLESKDSLYSLSCFLPLKSGNAVMAANQVTTNSKSKGSRLLFTNGGGENWSTIYRFGEEKGKIVRTSISDGGNAELEVVFDNNFEPPANKLRGTTLDVSGEKYTVVRNRNNKIIIYGTSGLTKINPNDSFEINNSTISSLAEDSLGTLYAAVGFSLLSDFRTQNRTEQFLGTISQVNKSATVTGVDYSGTINSISVKRNLLWEGSTSSLVCILNNQATLNEFVGKEMVITGYLAPSVSFISPLPSESFTASDITVSLSVQSFDLRSSGSISLKLDDREPVKITSVVHVFEGVSKGTHTITAQLLGADGIPLTNKEASASVVFSSEYEPKQQAVQILSPADGEELTTTTFKAIFKVYNFNTGVDGSLVYNIDSTRDVVVPFFGTGVTEVLIEGVADGQHLLKARLVNSSYQDVGEKSEIAFSVKSGGLPSIVVDPELAGIVFPSKTVTLTYRVANVSVPAEATVRITLDENTSKQQFISNDPTTFTLSEVPDGNHTAKFELLNATSVPYSNASAKTAISFNVDSTVVGAPSIYLTYPNDNSQITESPSKSLEIVFSTTDFAIPDEGGVIVKVSSNSGGTVNTRPEIYLNSALPYKILDATAGSYTVTATLASTPNSKLSNPTATQTIRFTITNGASARSFTSPTPVARITNSSGSTAAVNSKPQSTSSSQVAFMANVKSTEEESKKSDRRWTILSNSSSALTGTTRITVNGSVPLNMKGQSFTVVGGTSTLYVSFDQSVDIGEFDDGLVYVDEDESNAFKTYKINRQYSNRIELATLIDPSKPTKEDEVKPVAKGQKIRLLPATGENTIWLDFARNWGEDELNGSLVRVVGASAQQTEAELEDAEDPPRNSYLTVDSDEKSITIGLSSPYLLRRGSELYLDSLIMLPVLPFCGKNTSIDLDHCHRTELVGKLLSGNISSMNLYGTSMVDITPVLSSSLDNSIITSYPELLQGSSVLFYDTSDPRKRFRKEVIIIQGGKIRVKKGDDKDWSFGNTSSGISSGWGWTIDARWYGVTNGEPSYDNFISFQSKLSEDAIVGSYKVVVESTAGVFDGSKIELWDSLGNIQQANVVSINFGREIEIDAPLSTSFKVSNGAHIRIRTSSGNENLNGSSTSSNSEFMHSHLIRDGEVIQTEVEEYTINGYPYSHSHKLLNLIEDVKTLSYEYDTGNLLVAGNDSRIYFTRDNAQTWEVLIDASSVLDDWNGSFISMNRTLEGDLFAGTNDGRFVGQGVPEQRTPLAYPGDSKLLPSSSSASSVSSVSSVSSSSESSSPTSRSSSTALTYSTSSGSSLSSRSSLSSSTSPFKSTDSSESTEIQGE